MRSNRLHELFEQGDRPVVNGWLSSGSWYVAEQLSHAGYDSVTVDVQHGMFDLGTAVRCLQAVSSGGAVPMARCAALDPAAIGKLLDGGAYGIICPTIDDADAARALVAACRYPPRGRRSYGPARGLLYGGEDYVALADDTIQVWAMVESRTALTNLEEILAVDGLTGVYVGPNDLALSLGERPGTADADVAVRSAMTRVVAAARAHRTRTGVFCPGAPNTRWAVDAGFDLVTPGSDISVLRAAVARDLALVRGAGPAPVSTGY